MRYVIKQNKRDKGGLCAQGVQAAEKIMCACSAGKVLRLVLAFVLVVGLMPLIQPQKAMAQELEQNSTPAFVKTLGLQEGDYTAEEFLLMARDVYKNGKDSIYYYVLLDNLPSILNDIYPLVEVILPQLDLPKEMLCGLSTDLFLAAMRDIIEKGSDSIFYPVMESNLQPLLGLFLAIVDSMQEDPDVDEG